MMSAMVLSLPSTRPVCSAVYRSLKPTTVGNSSERQDGIALNLAGLHAELQSGHIRRGLDRALAVPQVARAVRGEAEQFASEGFIDFRLQLGANRAVGEAEYMVGVLEDEGQIENVCLAHRRADMRNVGDDAIERSRLDAVRHRLIVAELAVREDNDLNPALRAFLDQFLHHQRGFGVRRADRAVAAEAHRDGRGGSFADDSKVPNVRPAPTASPPLSVLLRVSSRLDVTLLSPLMCLFDMTIPLICR